MSVPVAHCSQDAGRVPEGEPGMDEIIKHAMSLGLRVAFRDLGRRDGELHSSGLVIINPRRT